MIGPSEEQVRHAFPEFEPLETLAALSGQKVVLKGSDSGTDVVLKVPRKWLPDGTDEEDKEIEALLDARIAAEIRNLRKIKNPYLVEILRGPEGREIEGHTYAWYLEPFFATSLRSLAGSRWEEEKVVVILEHLLNALSVLVDLKIVHRDIKPENIVLRHDGTPVLLDFGVSLFANEPTVTEEGDVAPFTKQYSAPEQWIARGREEDDLDFRTDLFCVGLVAFELLTGGGHAYGHAVDWPAYKARVRKHEYDGEAIDKVASRPMRTFVERTIRPERNTRYRTIAMARAAVEACK